MVKKTRQKNQGNPRSVVASDKSSNHSECQFSHLFNEAETRLAYIAECFVRAMKKLI